MSDETDAYAGGEPPAGTMSAGQREAMRYYPDAAAKIIAGEAHALGVAAERARIVAVLTSLRDHLATSGDFQYTCQGINFAINEIRDSAVRSASPAGADRQPVDRERCDDCDLYYSAWYADSDLWNAVIPDRVGMLCPRCFLIRAEPVTDVARVTWPDPPSRRDRDRGADWPGSKRAREDTSD